MQLQKLISPAALLLTVLALSNGPMIFGQVLQPIQSQPKNRPGQTANKQGSNEGQTLSKTTEADQPYKLSSRFHLQKETQAGYLIVKVELPKGSYIYSMTQQAPLRPSKIQVTKSNQFRLTGKFAPDRPPTIIAHDPIFKQRLEKHIDVVQFFAPVEISPGITPKNLTAEMTFSGQVCNDRGFCIPILDEKIRGKFAGYFQRTAKKRTSSQAKSPIGNEPH